MSALRAGIALVLLAALCGGLLAALHRCTRDRIAANEAQQLMRQLQMVLPAGSYDNDPRRDRIEVRDPDALGTVEPLNVYRARRGGRPAGLVLTTVAPDGYVDEIRLLIGISAAGRITGVRAIAHAETPGLGDGIDASRSDWILAFDGKPVSAPPQTWQLRRDGGDFDQLTGATITSRAVLNAVRHAMGYYQAHRDELYARPPVPETRTGAG